MGTKNVLFSCWSHNLYSHQCSFPTIESSSSSEDICFVSLFLLLFELGPGLAGRGLGEDHYAQVLQRGRKSLFLVTFI